MGIFDFVRFRSAEGRHGHCGEASDCIAGRKGGLWPKVAELAKTFNEPGHKIRVRDEAGGIVMLIGVVALRHSANAVSTGVLSVSGAISECDDQRSRKETH